MSLILRCPVCEKHYEANDDTAKQANIQCPLCGIEAAASDFSAMMFCPHCRGKLAVSLDMLNEVNLSCPRCEKTFVPTINISLDDDEDEDMDLFADDDEDEWEEPDWDDEDYVPSATRGDYSPSHPWDAPGMSIKDFI